jgi:hypothetical protein
MLYYFSCNHLYLYKYDSLRGHYAYSLYMHNIHVNLCFSSSSSSMLSHRRHSPKPGRWLPASAPSKLVTSAAQALTTVVPVDPHPIELFQRRQSKRNNTVYIHHRHRSLAFQYSTPRPPIEYKMDCTAPASADRTFSHNEVSISTAYPSERSPRRSHRREYSSPILLCVNLLPQPGAGKLPQGLRYFPMFFRQKIMVEHAGQSKRRTCTTWFILGARWRKCTWSIRSVQDMTFCKRIIAFEKNPIRAT